MKLYANRNRQSDIDNCEKFQRFMARFPWVKFYQPNAEKAPWHVQATIETEIGYKLILNFWPHKLKSQYVADDGVSGGTYEGIDGLRSMMAQAIEDSHDKETDFDVIEG